MATWLSLGALLTTLSACKVATQYAGKIDGQGVLRGQYNDTVGSNDLFIVAHEDDDLLFFNPDIQTSITNNYTVRVVFVTAGQYYYTDDYWLHREAGIKAAYALMAGAADSWDPMVLSVWWAGQTFRVRGYQLHSKPQISLVFMHLPDAAGFTGFGGRYGDGSLMQLWMNSGANGHLYTVPYLLGRVDNDQLTHSYTKQQLIDALTALMDDFNATEIHIPDITAHHIYWEHPTHHHAGLFAFHAQLQYAKPHTLYTHRAYTSAEEVANLDTATGQLKESAILAYAPHDVAVVRPSATVGCENHIPAFGVAAYPWEFGTAAAGYSDPASNGCPSVATSIRQTNFWPEWSSRRYSAEVKRVRIALLGTPTKCVALDDNHQPVISDCADTESQTWSFVSEGLRIERAAPDEPTFPIDGGQLRGIGDFCLGAPGRTGSPSFPVPFPAGAPPPGWTDQVGTTPCGGWDTPVVQRWQHDSVKGRIIDGYSGRYLDYDGQFRLVTVPPVSTRWQLQDVGSTAWPQTTSPPPPIALTGQPVLVTNTNTLNNESFLEVFVHGAAPQGPIYHVWQSRPATAAEPLGRYAGRYNVEWLGNYFSGNPVVVRDSDSKLHVFALNFGGAIYHLAQKRAGGAWAGASWNDYGSWEWLGNNFVDDPIVISNCDGRLEVVARTSSGSLYHLWQTSAGGPWSNPSKWELLGTGFVTNPVAVRNKDGRWELFAHTEQEAIYHIWQQSDGSWHNIPNWEWLGNNFVSNPTVAMNSDGRLELFARTNSGAIYHIWQTSPGCSWSNPSNWEWLGNHFVGDPVVIRNTDGRLELFARTGSGSIYHIWQTTPGGSWSNPSNWEWLGNFFESGPFVVQDSAGKLHIFGLNSSDHNLYHVFQTIVSSASQPSSMWVDPANWQLVGGPFTANPVITQANNVQLAVIARGTDGYVYSASWSADGTVVGPIAIAGNP